MLTYTFLQHYWWLLISVLAGLLVFLLFVQGANALILLIGKSEEERKTLNLATAKKWEITFTTLVTFGGAFFASFPLFYSTSFGGAYWVWMLILVSFVLQAVSYEFPQYVGNLLGHKGYWSLLAFNGFAGPFLIGAAVATFFNGASFVVGKSNITDTVSPVVSSWTCPWHGLEALADPWNWVLGITILLLALYLGSLYYVNNIEDNRLQTRSKNCAKWIGVAFVIFFLAFAAHLVTMNGFAEIEDNAIVSVEYKYLNNLLEMPIVAFVLVVGVVLVLWSLIKTWFSNSVRQIWFAGAGTILTIIAVMLLAGWNNTAYYPSLTDPQSSLTITNSCSSYFTLLVMTYASIAIPFVIAYIAYCWRVIDIRK